MTVLDRPFLCYILVNHTVQLCISNIFSNVTDVDYISGPYTATFPAGSTRAVVIVSLIDDDLLEGAENFALFIDLSSLPSNVSIGIYAQTLVTIIDNDCKFFEVCTYCLLSKNVHTYSYMHFVNDCTQVAC